LTIGSSTVKTVILTGPTASGKTELLDQVFGRGALLFSDGSYHSAEIINADSMQAYRGMDIGTAKPSASLLARLPHRLIDIVNPDEQYTAGDFTRLALQESAALDKAGILPVVSGGTGFYLRNFICGTSSAPPAEPGLRARIAAELARSGPGPLREELARIDPVSASRIKERDLYRLTRAVEIARATGKPPSSFAPPAQPRAGYEFLVVGVSRPREELATRIRTRVSSMMDRGLPEEVEKLEALGYGAESPGMKAIGYREFFEFRGKPRSLIAEAIILHTIQYAKRQMTFFRALPGIRWLPPSAELLSRLAAEFLLPSFSR